MGRGVEPAWSKGTLGLTVARERGDINREFESRLRVTQSTIDRLGLEKELRGHVGCVNCLEWNKDGSVLASASDDLHVMLWDPYRYKQLHNLATGHTGNIFSVKVRYLLLTETVSTGCEKAVAKCVAVNPRRPHMLAVGANDFYVRLYDTRMIKLAKLMSPGVPGSEAGAMWERQNLRCTRAGHGDLDNNIPRAACQGVPGLRHPLLQPSRGAHEEIMVSICKYTTAVDYYNDAIGVCPDCAILYSNRAAALMRRSCKYTTAVDYYNDAIGVCPDCAILYSNRAATLMRRSWSGDTYAAIKDCYRAIKLDAAHVKSHFRLAKGLMDLKRAREAHECLLYFKDKFPRHAKSHAVFLLQKDISSALEKTETHADEATAFWDTATPPPTSRRPTSSGPPETTSRLGSSDDGSLFIWSRKTGNIVRCLRGDESIVNCVQMHPSLFLLATSGIEAVVRLWSPQPEHRALSARRVHRQLHADVPLPVPPRHQRHRGCSASLEPATRGTVSSPGVSTVRCLRDESIVNCVQMHPSLFLLATSGIEAVVRLWSPQSERMRSDPFEAMLLNISLAGAPDRDLHPPPCRPT
ncbi:WD and tetratricopeptide repeats protein 1 [Operophtera brumata]|uniref:WD and tetratricopeptide repeats protein 1 n=1 Tax=Operophtera brumata TaxID=104452 RepID=A0A0L7L3Y6_OPEBR|nr:WD and tetratricopeptide repeats protein 1 [Operophtera brumata]